MKVSHVRRENMQSKQKTGGESLVFIVVPASVPIYASCQIVLPRGSAYAHENTIYPGCRSGS